MCFIAQNVFTNNTLCVTIEPSQINNKELSKRMEGSTNKFREYCREHNLTAAKVAEMIGCSKYTVYAYFRGERLPNRRTMKKMEKALKIDTREMFGL